MNDEHEQTKMQQEIGPEKMRTLHQHLLKNRLPGYDYSNLEQEIESFERQQQKSQPKQESHE